MARWMVPVAEASRCPGSSRGSRVACYAKSFWLRLLLLNAVSARAISTVLLLVIPATSRGADEIDKLLQRRLSPGVVALFARHMNDPRIVARLKDTLSE